MVGPGNGKKKKRFVASCASAVTESENKRSGSSQNPSVYARRRLETGAGVLCIRRHAKGVCRLVPLFEINRLRGAAAGLLKGACDPLLGSLSDWLSPLGTGILCLDMRAASPQTVHAFRPERMVPGRAHLPAWQSCCPRLPGQSRAKSRAGGSQRARRGAACLRAAVRHSHPQCVFRKLGATPHYQSGFSRENHCS